MTTQTANQFIGSKISLISKSEIRYEGILYSLDLQDATISLAKVKSFGTEDRPTERPVPHKEEVYEFIIFRGSDIKGIDVLEPPKAAATLTGGLPNDPAIVEVSHYHSAGQSGQAPPPNVGFPGSSGYSAPFGASMLGAKLPHHNQGHSFLDFVARSNASTPSLYSNRKSPVNDTGVQADDRGRNNRQYNNNNRQIDGRGSRQSSEDRRRQNRQPQGGQADRQIGYQPRGRGNYVNRGGSGGGGGGNFRGQRGTRGGYRQGIIKAQMPPRVTFEEAFDFDKANEELANVFSELKLKSEEGEKKKGDQDGGDGNAESDEQENKEPAEPYYVKESFFDKISCESTERSKGKSTRPDWRAERKLNAETFGVPVSNGQRRGGGGYRGGFRGGFRDNFRGNYGRGGGYQQRGYGYGGYGNSGGGYYQYNNRYNGGGRGHRGNYNSNRSQQQNQTQQNQPQQATPAATQ